MDTVAELNATLDALTQKYSVLVDAYQQARAQLAGAVAPEALADVAGKAKALLDSVSTVIQ